MERRCLEPFRRHERAQEQLEMLFGALPFSHDPKDARDYTASISSLVFKFPSKSTVSPEARDLIGLILVPQEKRISLDGILKHPWITLNLDLIF